jgi:hypothetical protein
MLSVGTQIGIAHNGPMTSFSLNDDADGIIAHLCRDDLVRIADGIFTFPDGRPPIELDEPDKRAVTQMAMKLLGEITRGEFWADIGEGFADGFRDHARRFGVVRETDLGRMFFHDGEVHVFLGARPLGSDSPGGCELVAKHLPSGDRVVVSLSDLEQALGKATSEGWKRGF